MLFRPWRLAAGACLGAACATKWSGLYDIGAFLVLAYLWDVGARRTAGIRRPWLAALRRDSPALGLGLVVMPIVVYTASWTGWFLSPDGYDRHAKGSGIFGTLHSWIFYQSEQLNFHRHLSAGHPYKSSPLSWPVLGRPISFYYQSVPDGKAGCRSPGGCASEVLAIGTPAIWWVGLAALIACLAIWVGRRDWRAGLVVIGYLFNWLPWVAQPDRTMFLFYALPMLPFLVLGLTTVAQLVLGPRQASERRRTAGGIAVGAYVLIVLANFVFLYPILDGRGHPVVVLAGPHVVPGLDRVPAEAVRFAPARWVPGRRGHAGPAGGRQVRLPASSAAPVSAAGPGRPRRGRPVLCTFT